MKNVSKVRPGTFRPRVENLENRWQPGSLLFGGVGLAGAALADPLPQVTSTSESSLSLIRHHDDSTLTSQTVSASAPASASPSQAVVQTSTTSAPTQSAGLPAAPAAPAPASAAAFAAPAKSGAAQSGGVQSAPQTGQTLAAPTAAALPPAVPVVAPVATPAPTLTADPNVHIVSVTTYSGGIGDQLTQNWGTYLHNSSTPPVHGQSTATHVKFTTNGLFIVGTQPDPTTAGQEDLAIINLATGGNSATVALISGFSTGNMAWGRNIDVSSDGQNVYVDGFTGANPKNQGTPGSEPLSNSFILSIKSDFSAINWSLADTSTRSAEYGLKLDSTGTNLYISGMVDNTANGGPADNLEVGKITAATGAVVQDFFYTFLDPNSNPTPTVDGRVAGIDAVTPTSTGTADFAANIDTQDANGAFAVEPLFGTISADGMTVNALRYLSVGTRGIGGDISLGSSGNYYFTGSYSFDGTTYGLLIAQFTQANTSVYGWVWTFSGSSGNLNTFGTGMRVGSDGSAYTSATIIDPTAPPTANASLEVDHFSTDGSVFVDGTLGAIGGSNNDFGVALDNGGIANNTYAVGATTSPDFAVTTGAYQTTFVGPLDGYALSLHLS